MRVLPQKSTFHPFISIENSMWQFFSAIIFLALCILLYAVVGQGIFGGVKRGPGAIRFSFRLEVRSATLSQASLLIQILTTPRTPFCFCLKLPRVKGDPPAQFEESLSNSFYSWQLVQKDCSIQPPHCTQLGTAYDDCGTQAAWMCVASHALCL